MSKLFRVIGVLAFLCGAASAESISCQYKSTPGAASFVFHFDAVDGRMELKRATKKANITGAPGEVTTFDDAMASESGAKWPLGFYSARNPHDGTFVVASVDRSIGHVPGSLIKESFEGNLAHYGGNLLFADKIICFVVPR